MGAFIDMVGFRAGKLLAVSEAGRNPRGRATWNCTCDCGATCIVDGSHLRSGNTTSCGCHKRAVLGVATTTHGMSGTKEFAVWKTMTQRCTNPNNPKWPRYGGRGVRVCDRWREFSAFYADMGSKPDGHSIERRDNDGDYEPGNCYWATSAEQGANRGNNRRITHQGQTKPVVVWARELGITTGRMYTYFYRHGYTTESVNKLFGELK